MKKRVYHVYLFLGLLIASIALAAGFERIPKDTLKLGSGSSSNKTIEFDVNLSPNPDLKYNIADDSIDINRTEMKLGPGTTGDIDFVFNEGSGPNAPRFRWNQSQSQIQFSPNGTTFKNIGTGGGDGGGINLAIESNPDCETGDPPINYTESGGTFDAETTNPLLGNQSCRWDSNANAQTLDSDLFTIPVGLRGNQCLIQILYKYEVGASGDYKLQMLDGSNLVIVEGDLVPTTGQAKNAFFISTCPDPGSIKMRILSQVSDADPITFESVHIGSNIREISVASAEVVFRGHYPNTAGCSWSTSSTTLASFGATVACPGITIDQSSSSVTVDSTEDDLPTIKFTTVPPGIYEVSVTLNQLVTVSGNESTLALIDNTGADVVLDQGGFANPGGNDEAHTLYLSGIVTKTTAGPLTFEIQGATSGTLSIENSPSTGFFPEMGWTVKRFPLDTERALLLSQANGYFIKANLGGSNADLGVVNVATYTGITNGGLNLILQPGSAPALVPCETTFEPTGLQCTGGTTVEQLGISFFPPFSGFFDVCFSFGHGTILDTNERIETVFQLVETPPDSQTILQLGENRLSCGAEGGATNIDTAHSVTLCSRFKFDSVGQKTIRLFYEQLISLTPDSSLVLLDRAASLGQRDMAITVTAVTQTFPLPVVLNTIVSSSSAGTRLVSANITQPGGVPTINRQDGVWLNFPLIDNSLGNVTHNISGNIFSGIPNCWCSAESAASDRSCKIDTTTTPSATVLRTQTFVSSTGAPADLNYSLFCNGPQ